MKKNLFKKYLISGLLVLVPIWVTFTILEYLIEKVDNILALLPKAYQPDTLLGIHIPGLGLLLVLLIVFFTGMLATNFIGKYLIELWDATLAKIPLVRSIHASVKKILSTMLTPSSESFRKVLLVEFPHKGTWTLAFQTGVGLDEAIQHVGEEMLTVYVPTTPNPTGGYLLLIAKKDSIELNISVDNALKWIISLGVILPKINEKDASLLLKKNQVSS